MKRTVEERFWSKVDKNGPVHPTLGTQCWLWTGNRIGKGYGQFTIGNRKVLAHRFAYELVNGPIAEGMMLCHHCDTPPCVRQEHHFQGTNADNMRDAYAKGRMRPPGTTGNEECRRGHPFTPENTMVEANGRRCRTCSRARRRAAGFYARRAPASGELTGAVSPRRVVTDEGSVRGTAPERYPRAPRITTSKSGVRHAR